jgi:hypothetical protein
MALMALLTSIWSKVLEGAIETSFEAEEGVKGRAYCPGGWSSW